MFSLTQGEESRVARAMTPDEKRIESARRSIESDLAKDANEVKQIMKDNPLVAAHLLKYLDSLGMRSVAKPATLPELSDMKKNHWLEKRDQKRNASTTFQRAMMDCVPGDVQTLDDMSITQLNTRILSKMEPLTHSLKSLCALQRTSGGEKNHKQCLSRVELMTGKDAAFPIEGSLRVWVTLQKYLQVLNVSRGQLSQFTPFHSNFSGANEGFYNLDKEEQQYKVQHRSFPNLWKPIPTERLNGMAQGDVLAIHKNHSEGSANLAVVSRLSFMPILLGDFFVADIKARDDAVQNVLPPMTPPTVPQIFQTLQKRLQTSCTREFKAMLTDSDAGKEVVASVGILAQRSAKDEVGDEHLKFAKNALAHGSMPFVEKEVLEDDVCWTVRNCATFGSAKVVGVV